MKYFICHPMLFIVEFNIQYVILFYIIYRNVSDCWFSEFYKNKIFSFSFPFSFSFSLPIFFINKMIGMRHKAWGKGVANESLHDWFICTLKYAWLVRVFVYFNSTTPSHGSIPPLISKQFRITNEGKQKH